MIRFLKFDPENYVPTPPRDTHTMYLIRFLFTKEPEGVSAVALNLPGCASQGDTLEAAIANVQEAAVGLLSEYVASGQPIPWHANTDPIPPFTERRDFLVSVPNSAPVV